MTTTPFAWDHLLYRLFDANDHLLYIGRTNDLRKRLDRHSRVQSWWPEVARSQVETFPDLASLCAAEKAAIIGEDPTHNVVYKGRAVVTEDGEPAPAYLAVSVRVTTVAEVLHATCRESREANYPEEGTDDSPPCHPCMLDAVAIVEALDVVTGEEDTTVPAVREMLDDPALIGHTAWPPLPDDFNTAVARERDGAGNPF